MRLDRVTNELARPDAVRSCRLRIVGGPDVGREVTISPVGVVVGADPASDIALSDPAVSSRHCTIMPTELGFKVVDLGSTNGTHLDGIALTQGIVPVGAVLRVGASLLQLMPAEATVQLEPSEAGSFGGMIGSSVAMRRIYTLLERASGSDVPVLLGGESGTGKELAARALHDAGRRANAPFVVFDCGAATDTLIESQLFGHVRGAFTGAVGDRQGAFAEAHGGTLFLDELGDLPLALQPKLLRLLETGEVTQVGSTKTQRFDVRIIAATHRDLWQEVAAGSFRGDLYYRLAVVEAHLPALRQRRDDVPGLAAMFLAKCGRGDARPDGRNLDRLLAYHWPGNVRELRNVIARAVALSRPGAAFAEMPIMLRGGGPTVEAQVLISADRPFNDAKADVIAQFEKGYLTDLLRRAGDNVSQAARMAGLERKHLYKVLERAGLVPVRDRGE